MTFGGLEQVSRLYKETCAMRPNAQGARASQGRDGPPHGRGRAGFRGQPPDALHKRPCPLYGNSQERCGEIVMGWSAAATARGLTTGKRGRLVPGYTARRPIGRATGGSAGNETQGRLLPLRSGKTEKGGKTAKEASHEDTHD